MLLRRYFIILFLLIGCGRGGPVGEPGAPGRNGLDGANGSNGAGCTVETLAPGQLPPNGGALISCGASQVFIFNGENGQDGQDGQNGLDGADGADATPGAYSVVETLNPCSVNGAFDEVLLLLHNGQILASMSENANGKNTRFVLLPDGAYQTTDYNSACNFTISTAGTQRCLNSTGLNKCWSV